MRTSAPLRILLGFLAAALSVLVFHQGMVALLWAGGVIPRPPYSLAPVPPYGVPVLLSLCFWGGLYGAAYGLVLPALPDWPRWLLGLCLGLCAAMVGWFVVAPIKGLPVAAGWVPQRMLLSVLINGAWGIGTALILPLLLPRRRALAR